MSYDDTEAPLDTVNSFEFIDSARGHEQDKECHCVHLLPYSPRGRKRTQLTSIGPNNLEKKYGEADFDGVWREKKYVCFL